MDTQYRKAAAQWESTEDPSGFEPEPLTKEEQRREDDAEVERRLEEMRDEKEFYVQP